MAWWLDGVRGEVAYVSGGLAYYSCKLLARRTCSSIHMSGRLVRKACCSCELRYARMHVHTSPLLVWPTSEPAMASGFGSPDIIVLKICYIFLPYENPTLSITGFLLNPCSWPWIMHIDRWCNNCYKTRSKLKREKNSYLVSAIANSPLPCVLWNQICEYPANLKTQ